MFGRHNGGGNESARTVRVLFACFLSGRAYLGIILLLFKPDDDDRKILAALDRFIPRPLNWILARKLGTERGIPGPAAGSARRGG